MSANKHQVFSILLPFHISNKIPFTDTHFHLFCTATVVTPFTTIHNSDNRHGEPFPFRTFTFSYLKHGAEAGRNDCIQH